MVEKFFTLEEVGELLRYDGTMKSLKRRIRTAGTPYRKMGSNWILSEADVEALIDSLPGSVAKPTYKKRKSQNRSAAQARLQAILNKGKKTS